MYQLESVEELESSEDTESEDDGKEYVKVVEEWYDSQK